MAELDNYHRLLDRLKESRGKTRKGQDSGNSRSYEERKAEADRRQAEYRANQDRYRGDFEIVGGGKPGMMFQQVVTGYYNPETGATWSAPHSGYKPKEGTGWVKGYGPGTNEGKSPVYTQPGGGPEIGRPPTITPGVTEATIPGVTEATPSEGRKFEALLRERMRKF